MNPACQAAWCGDLNFLKATCESTGIGSVLGNLAMDERGYAPVHYAASVGQVGVLEFLCGLQGTDASGGMQCPVLSARDAFGRTPLLTAVEAGQPEAVAALLQLGALVDDVDLDRRSPLFVAVQAGHLDVARFLCAAGANVHLASLDGETPLHVAAAEGDLGIMRLLLEFGAFPNVLDNAGESPLHAAARASSAACIEALVKAGADPLQQSADGDTPMFLASNAGARDCCRFLATAVPSSSSSNAFFPSHFPASGKLLDPYAGNLAPSSEMAS